VYGSGGRSSLCGFRSANLVCGVCGDGDGGHRGASQGGKFDGMLS
jgi:hypothetical protein